MVVVQFILSGGHFMSGSIQCFTVRLSNRLSNCLGVKSYVVHYDECPQQQFAEGTVAARGAVYWHRLMLRVSQNTFVILAFPFIPVSPRHSERKQESSQTGFLFALRMT